MFHDARSLPPGTVLQGDVAIVGAGAAGITLARALRGRGHTVLLLESGGLELDEPTQALYAGDQRGVATDPPDATRLRYFGGTTNHWAGWCRPLEAWDFHPPDPADPRRWPFPRDAIAPYYRAAQAELGGGPTDYDDLAWPGLPALPLDPARLRTALFQIRPQRLGPDNEALLRADPATQVWLNTNVLEVQADDTAVTGLRARAGLDGAEFAIRARFVVLAAGGLENARLLLLSNRTRPAGLGNTHDLVGRYFMDHPWLASLGFVAFAQPARDLRLYLDETETAGTGVLGALAPAGPLPGQGSFRVVLHPSRRVVEGVAALKGIGSDIAGLRWPRQFLSRLGSAVSDYDAVIDSTYKTLFGTRQGLFSGTDPLAAPIVGATIDINIEQLPTRDNRVTLSRSRDALGQNRIAIDWRPGAAEKQAMRRAAELVGQEFGRLGIGRLRAKMVQDTDSWPGDLQGSRHHMGTTRMADSPRAGVVDANCRVHGLANLYIAGSSVFPGAGYANPTLTIIALALRLGDELARHLG